MIGASHFEGHGSRRLFKQVQNSRKEVKKAMEGSSGFGNDDDEMVHLHPFRRQGFFFFCKENDCPRYLCTKDSFSLAILEALYGV